MTERTDSTGNRGRRRQDEVGTIAECDATLLDDVDDRALETMRKSAPKFDEFASMMSDAVTRLRDLAAAIGARGTNLLCSPNTISQMAYHEHKTRPHLQMEYMGSVPIQTRNTSLRVKHIRRTRPPRRKLHDSSLAETWSANPQQQQQQQAQLPAFNNGQAGSGFPPYFAFGGPMGYGAYQFQGPCPMGYGANQFQGLGGPMGPVVQNLTPDQEVHVPLCMPSDAGLGEAENESDAPSDLHESRIEEVPEAVNEPGRAKSTDALTFLVLMEGENNAELKLGSCKEDPAIESRPGGKHD
ncbi:hypothetical protein LX36DRAFT_745384 [Colletotrichum falcatum]|nr:hypothetical protein LX36DRAFT_745384 [Colletotrichum falcatum]